MRPLKGHLIAIAMPVLLGAAAVPARASDPISPEVKKAIDALVLANHILADQGVLDGYGHVSVRNPANPRHFFVARSMAPALVTAADIVEHDEDGNGIDARGRKLYLERFIHGEIYRFRPDVNAVVHSHSPSVIPFGISQTTLRPVYHMAGFLGAGVPVFDIRDALGMTDMLVSSPAAGKALVKTLGDRPVALMRGHGDVVVAPDLHLVVYRAIYTEANARLQAQALGLGPSPKYLAPEEAARAEASINPTIDRAWDLWVRRVEKDAK